MRKFFIYLILTLLGVGIIVAIFAAIGFDKIWTNLRRVGFDGFIIYFLISVISLALTGIGWWIVLRSHQIKISALHTAIAHLIAFGINLLIPSMYIGGEPFRAYYIGQVYNIPKMKVFATAILAKFMELMAFLLFLYFGTTLLVLAPESEQLLSPTLRHTLIAVDIVLGLVFILAMVSIFRNFQFLTKFMKGIRKLGVCTKAIDKIIPNVCEMEETISIAFRENWKIALLVLFSAMISVAITFLKPLVIFYFLMGETHLLSLTELALIFTVGQLFLSFHITPAAVGVWEGSQLGIFHILNIDAGIAAAFIIVSRLIELILAGAGCYLMTRHSILHLTREKITTITQMSTEYKKAIEESSDGACKKSD